MLGALASSGLIPGTEECAVPIKGVDNGSNAQNEQFNHADSDHQHRKCYGIVVEPIPLVHEMPPLFPFLSRAGRQQGSN